MRLRNLFIVKTYYTNDNDALVPELWAQESLYILEQNMVAAGLVHTDFKNEIQEYGDVVNTRRPSRHTATRKTDADDVTIQDVSLTNVPITLNQHPHDAFILKDGELSLAFKNLVEVHLQPSSLALAEMVDRIILGQYPRFLANANGTLGALSGTTAKATILDARKVGNQNLCPVPGRNMILTTNSETSVLNTDIFLTADKVGDEGTALREASLGRKLGFDHYMDQNMGSVAIGNTIAITTLINNPAGYPVGTTVLTVDGGTTIVAGTWATIAGYPYRITSVTGAPATSITITPGLKAAVVDNQVITTYTPGQVNFAAGYAAGYQKEITIDTFTVAPQVGQSVTFGNVSTPYTIISVNGLVGITLDRPLDAAIVDDVKVNILPAGEYNFWFRRDAISFVCRPLALPDPRTGAWGGIAYSPQSGLALRVVMQYQGIKQGLLVTQDLLCGIQVLDVNQGGVMLG